MQLVMMIHHWSSNSLDPRFWLCRAGSWSTYSWAPDVLQRLHTRRHNQYDPPRRRL